MEAHELREQLITYIHLVDEKKLEALHTLLIAEQEQESEYKWWEDEKFVAELEDDRRKIESGEMKTYTQEEVFAEIYKQLEKKEPAHV